MIENDRPSSPDSPSDPLHPREAGVLSVEGAFGTPNFGTPKVATIATPLTLSTHSATLRTQRYQRLLHQLLTLPFGILLLLSGLVGSGFDLYHTTNNKLRYSTTVTALIAQTASEQNPTLMQRQIAYALANIPFVDTIVFYPISLPQNLQIDSSETRFNLTRVFFGDTFTITEPVAIADYSDPQSKQLIGYIQTTLNLKKARVLWLASNFPIIAVFFLAFSLMLSIMLGRIQKITKRLPLLEHISHQLLQHDPASIAPTDLANYSHQLDKRDLSLIQSPLPVWVFEQALRQLLEMQHTQLFQLNQLSQDYQQLQQKTKSQSLESSNFLNSLTHEFKLTLNKIQAGITLLNNQYISQEQKDALDIIEAGQRNLTIKLNQIIQLQRLERGQVGIQLEQINPTQLLKEIIALYDPIASQKGLMLSLEAQHTDYSLEGDRQKIMAILTAIIKNAVQFTEKGHILVTSQLVNLPHSIRWQVAVADTGIGIAEKHLSRIFEPFFQVNPEDNGSLTGDNSGSEMDLSLAHKVTTLLGGVLEVESELGKGSTFTFTIKLNDWQKHFERQWLKDKTVVIFLADGVFHPIVDKISKTGANVKTFHDIALLVKAVLNQSVDALLISPDIAHSLVVKLVQQIRQRETTHRMLIILYYQNHNKVAIEALQAMGVDYFEHYDPDTYSHEQSIKRLMALLN